MIGDFAKEYLHSDLRNAREVMLWKLDGLSRYDLRRPLTATGTNLLGAGQAPDPHRVTVLRRDLRPALTPSPWPIGLTNAYGRTPCGRPSFETREEIIDRYRAAWRHSDATINALAVDAPGHAP
jgi:hypothetical protein